MHIKPDTCYHSTLIYALTHDVHTNTTIKKKCDQKCHNNNSSRYLEKFRDPFHFHLKGRVCNLNLPLKVHTKFYSIVDIASTASIEL